MNDGEVRQGEEEMSVQREGANGELDRPSFA